MQADARAAAGVALGEQLAVVSAFSGAAELLERPSEAPPWLLVEDAGDGAVAVGPRFGRGSRLCFRCYWGRRLSQYARECRPASSAALRQARVQECLKELSAYPSGGHERQLVVRRDAVETHWVLPLPCCERCHLLPRPDASLGLSELVSDRVGVVSHVRDLAPGLALLPTVIAEGGRTDAFAPARAVAIGMASDAQRELACVRAIAECVERYCPSFIPPGVVTALSRDLPGPAYVSRATRRHEREHPEAPLSWMQARRLGTAQAVWVPAAHLLLPFEADPIPRVQTSNGVAAGRSFEDALQRAILEIEERDAFMRAWYGPELPWACDAELLRPEMRLARVPSPWGPPTVAAFLELPEPPFCAAGLACRVDEAAAARSAQLEAIAHHALLARDVSAGRSVPAGRLRVRDYPLAHATEQRWRGAREPWLAPRGCKGTVRERALDQFLFCELTTPDVELAGVHVVRAFHPDRIDFHAVGGGHERAARDVPHPYF